MWALSAPRTIAARFARQGGLRVTVDHQQTQFPRAVQALSLDLANTLRQQAAGRPRDLPPDGRRLLGRHQHLGRFSVVIPGPCEWP